VLEAPGPIEKAATIKQPAGRPPFLAFVADGETETLLRECVTQLAPERGSIIRGGITRAIAYLGQHRSPDTLIVDISDVELPISKVNELAEVCEPGVAVIAIGNRNEIGLYRDLLHAGVTDYVVKPLSPQLLAKALMSGQIRGGEPSPIRKKLGALVAFVGARGGVGTTTLAVNTAWHLANRQTRRVALVDLDLQNGDCALALEIKPSSGLREALANPLRIDNSCLSGSCRRSASASSY
jgi:pilus assembly protein CpaE